MSDLRDMVLDVYGVLKKLIDRNSISDAHVNDAFEDEKGDIFIDIDVYAITTIKQVEIIHTIER